MGRHPRSAQGTRSRTHLLWDQVGQTTAFTTANARRVLDSRAD